MEAILFPDAEAVAIEWLRQDLVDHGTPMVVADTVPDPRKPAFVTVRRTGGPRRDLVTDMPSLTFDCWAEKASEASALANLVRALVGAWRGRSADGTTVYRVDEFAGPSKLPDPASKQSRYTFTASVAMRGRSVPTGGIS